jgi:REP element-mobilizing transposase RayT
MPRRDIEFVTDEYYHVFNRSIEKRDIFMDTEDLYFFFKRLSDLNNVNDSDTYKHSRKRDTVEMSEDKLVEIVAYCLLPNHFHLLLKQKTRVEFLSLYTGLAHLMSTFLTRNISVLEGYFSLDLKPSI